MRISNALRTRLIDVLLSRTYWRRSPDVVIGGARRPYLHRWHVIPRNPVLNVYVHRFMRSDDDGALHDHPWASMSIVLIGGCMEHTIAAGGVHVRTPCLEGSVVFRRAKTAHRIELGAPESPAAIAREVPCWTLFVTGPRIRQWGFHCPQGWRHWREFTNADDGGRTTGRGCE